MFSMVECPKDYKISRLIAKKLMGVILPEDEERLNAWLEEDARNKDLYRRILETENLSVRDMYAKRLDVEHTWDTLRVQLVGQRKCRSLFSSWQIGVVASVILFVGIGLYWGFWKKSEVEQVEMVACVEMRGAKAVLVTSQGNEIVLQDSTVRLISLGGGMVAQNDGSRVSYEGNGDMEKDDVLEYNTIRVPRGGEYKLFLSDNTEVFLNSDSEIRFPVVFTGQTRQVSLKGEAYFKVKKNPACPFFVEVKPLEVEVTGTTFGIRAYPDETDVLTTLETGTVRVRNGEAEVNLSPDRQAIFDRSTTTLSVGEVDTDLFLAWKDGRIIFDDCPLEKILAEIGRWYDLDIFYAREEVRSYRFSLNIKRHETFGEVLKLLEAAGQIGFEVNGNTIVVR